MPTPSEKLRELVEEQVSTRSPRPHSPASVSRCAPQASAEAAHFGKAAGDQRRAGVLAEARPSTTPQAIASTFLTAPPISAPTTSSET